MAQVNARTQASPAESRQFNRGTPRFLFLPCQHFSNRIFDDRCERPMRFRRQILKLLQKILV